MNKQLKEYLELRQIFDQKDESGFKSTHKIGIDQRVTELGIFLPANTIIMYKIFTDLISSGFINPLSIFLDAGSGDARVNHMATLSGIKHSIGIEYDPEIIAKSKQQTKEFEDRGIIKKNCIQILQGDFTKTKTYTNNNIEIKNIKTFFNYINGWKELLVFIDKHCLPGTRVMIIDEQFNISKRITDEITTFKSIELKDTIKYVHQKGKEGAEILTRELLQEIKKKDKKIESQHIYVDVSPSGEFDVAETGYTVLNLYLLEKVI